MTLYKVATFLRGIVRPVITFALVGAVIQLALVGSLPSDKLLELTLVTTGFWFGSRTSATK